MSENPTTSPAPLRVLVVENDPKWRQVHLINLQRWGYQAYAAEPKEGAADLFQSLWEDAKAKARRYRCHIALVDMRLRDDDDPSDTSGLRLVPELAPTVSIIVSGYGDRKTVREALKSPPKVPERAYDFVGKEDGPEAFLTAIQEVEKTIWCRRPVEIDCPDDLCSEVLTKRIFAGEDVIPFDEVDDILRRLFPKAWRLKIEPVGITERTSGLVLRRRSVILKVTENNHNQPVIVKIAPSGRIRKEINGFSLISGHLRAARYARPEGVHIELWDLSGIVYQFIGNDQQYPAVTFSNYYAVNSPEDIGTVLTNCDKFWSDLHRVVPLPNSQPRKKRIFTAYIDVWGHDWCNELRRYQRHSLLGQYPDPFSRLRLPDPISWVIKKIKLNEDGTYNDRGLPDTEIALTHGDLHGDNLFVDTRKDVWVIDYERTGFGPKLQDYVELENDILTHLIEMDTEDWPEYFHLLLELLTSISPLPLSLPGTKFDKERIVIGRLRELSSGNDERCRLWGLLLNALFRVTLLLSQYDKWEQIAKDMESKQAERSLQKLILGIKLSYSLAGMICHRLDRWNKKWPPSDWMGRQDQSHHLGPNFSTISSFDYDVFISYSSKDRIWVGSQLIPRLERDGLRVCVDYRDFDPGAPSVKEMERAVTTSRKTVLVLTPHYLNSAWAEFESLMLATLDPANRGRRLIPILRERCELPARINYLTYINLADPEDIEFAWKRLLDALRKPS